jgi:ATP-dependent helicase/nuclease subunit B
MGEIYNISLKSDFWKEIVSLLKKKIHKCEECKIFLPNHRNCRELKKHILSESVKSLFASEVGVFSDCLVFDEQQIIFLLMHLLKIENNDIPINTLYDLAENLRTFIKKMIMNDIDFSQINWSTAAEYFNLNKILKSNEVSSIIDLAKASVRQFIESLSGQKIIAIGICDDSYYSTLFLKNVVSSLNGMVITLGLESCQYKNYETSNNIINLIQSRHSFSAPPILSISSIDDFESPCKIKMEEFVSRSDEAFGIALAVRNAIFEKQKVLIVSPDKILTKKIKSELLRWNIFANDSMGDEFSRTSDGIIVATAMDVLKNRYNTVDVINFLKMNRDYLGIVYELEHFFRKRQTVPSFFFRAFDLWEPQVEYQALVETIDKMKKNLINFDTAKTFSEWFDICQQLISIVNTSSAEKFLEISGEYLANSIYLSQMSFVEFDLLVKRILSSVTRASIEYTNNVIILGVIESQLSDTDLVIIAGANEEIWFANDYSWTHELMPQALRNINERKDLTRCILERLLHKKSILITRSEIINGIRHQECKYITKFVENSQIKKSDELKKLISSADGICNSETIPFCPPNPGLHMRPQKIWVSDIDLLVNNPYAFHAKRILKLSEGNYINEPKNVRGNYIHKVLEEFIKSAKDTSSITELNYYAKKVLRNKWLLPSDFGLWFFKTKKIFSFVVDNVDSACQHFAEVNGNCTLQIAPNYSIDLCCKVDRIDMHPNGYLSIVDYKTGMVPSKSQVKSGVKMQLPVEAIIARANGFKLGKTEVEQLLFWELGGIDGAKSVIITNDLKETDELSDATIEELKKVIRKYNVLGDPYEINADYPYDKAYMHLARVAEWRDA